MYSKTVLKHFKNPHNQGKMKNPDVVGESGSAVCGDTMKLYLKVSAKGGSQPKVDQPLAGAKTFGGKSQNSRQYGGQAPVKSIVDIKFETLGCAAAIASSSVLTDMAKGKTLDEAEKITKQDVVKKLGGLPEEKIHCSLLAVDALQNAIDKLRKI